MSEIIYLDGQYVPRQDAKISVYDHGVLYGDGVFEGIRLYQKNVFRLRQHLDRLWSSARGIMLEIPLSREEMTEAVCETCRRNGLVDGYIRLVVTRGVGDLGISPWLCPKATVFVIAAKIQLYAPELYEKGLEIITAATRRIAPDTFSARTKSLNYLNNIMAKINARNANAPEALMLNREGMIVEATADNVFLVKNGEVFTPPTYMGALRGITRDTVIEVAHRQGFPVREEPFALFEVYDADEMFLTGTAAEIIAVTRVDGRPIGDGKPGAITNRLLGEFRKLTVSDGVRI
ncbi:branched-chain-amino-acid transaminase [Candidatus Poribacteria bacterium]|nr:branched-chain-amino-acid transaminase [Candidatus Poribacteria bacterium]